MQIEPSIHKINISTGSLSHHTGAYQKKISDLAGIYQNAADFEALCQKDAERIVYQVEDVRPVDPHGNQIFGTTFMEPGNVGGECFLTRGHVHAIANRPEIYRGEAGKGVMLLESPEGETRILEIEPNVIVNVPNYWIHRSVNTGDEPLVMSFCYPADSGQDYEVIAETNGMATRIFKDGSGWKAVKNEKYTPRTAQQIQRIYDTKG